IAKPQVTLVRNTTSITRQTKLLPIPQTVWTDRFFVYDPRTRVTRESSEERCVRSKRERMPIDYSVGSQRNNTCWKPYFQKSSCVSRVDHFVLKYTAPSFMGASSRVIFVRRDAKKTKREGRERGLTPLYDNEPFVSGDDVSEIQVIERLHTNGLGWKTVKDARYTP
ncbi:unnamed protein product, partial [Nesidiocoris tenuis]